MIGRINKDGDLYIMRGDVEKAQFCPGGYFCVCGDSCPQFGNLVKPDVDDIRLPICQSKILYFEKLTDERGVKADGK
jgi:DNA-directed RNA polymerase subunit RPC12/RpoP